MTHMTESISGPRKAWLAPLVSTLVTVPVMAFCFMGVGLSQMACDPCAQAESDVFEPSFQTGFRVFLLGLLLPIGMLVTGWVLALTPRHPTLRAALAVAAPFAVLLLVVVFAAIVVWP